MTSFVRELDPSQPGQTVCLVKIGDDYFRVSLIGSAFDHGGAETLAFACDSEGNVTSWADVAGGRGRTREETVAELEAQGPDPSKNGRGMFGDDKTMEDRDPIEVLATAITTITEIARKT